MSKKPDQHQPSTTDEDEESPSISPVYMDDLEPEPYPNFRPDRIHAKELGPIRAQVEVRTPTDIRSCELHDISTSGVAFVWPEGTPLPLGTRLGDLSVLGDEHLLYRGGAKVRSVRQVDGRTIIGVSFTGTPMNMKDVIQLRTVRERDGDPRLDLRPGDMPWHSGDAQPHRFEALVAELHLFLKEAEHRFGSLEKDLPWHVLHGQQASPARKALVTQLREGFVPAFVDYSVRIDAALRGTGTAHDDSLKAFSRAMLHDYFMMSPLMHRCMHKPLGYPGDYIVMRYLYEDWFEGPSLLSKAIHLGGVSTPACDAVRARKDMILEKIRTRVRERATEGARTRIISIAAGPAQETIELLRGDPEIASYLDVLLFDQDHGALEHVNDRVNLLRAQGHGEGMTIQLRHDTIRRLLEDEKLFESFGPADIVFSSGLFDYLRFRTGVRLIRNLYRLLAPGGSLYVGNIVPEQATRWIFDHHLDWFLVYRSREELLTMGEDAVARGQACIVEEASGFNPFVLLTGV